MNYLHSCSFSLPTPDNESVGALEGTCKRINVVNRIRRSGGRGRLLIVAPRPACTHSDSSGSHRYKRNTKNPRFFPLEALSSSSALSLFTEVRFPTGRAWSGEPLAVCRLPASGSCLTIFRDAPEGCTSFRTWRALRAAAWNAGEPSVARTRYPYGCDEAG
jgi:hypothetical protein